MLDTVPATSKLDSPPIDPIRVLIVEDDPDFLDLLIAQIGQIPHVQITAAHDPTEALERLSDPTYRLVVSDWALRESTGGDVLTAADDRRHSEMPDLVPLADKIPVLFMSGSEKVNETHRLHTLHHFEPVSFISKRCGPSMIGMLAEHILLRFRTPLSPPAC